MPRFEVPDARGETRVAAVPASDYDALAAQIAAKPSAASVAAQIAGKADVSSVPVPATSMPPGVADNGAQGTATSTFALADHTHASKARKAIKVMPSAATTYTWVYPTPFANGVVPVCNGIAQVPNGTTDLFNVQVMGQPTNTQAVFQINRVSSGLLSLLTGALSINPTPIAATLHLIALEP